MKKSMVLKAMVAVCSVFLFGCMGGNKIVLPAKQMENYYAVPSQQEVISDAVNMAVAQLQAAPFVGKKVYVETLGVMPHTDRDLLEFCGDAVRSHLGKNGANIVFEKLVTTSQPGTASPTVIPVMAPPDASEVDYIVVVAVEAGGADQNKETSFLNFAGSRNLLAKARLKVSAYPTRGGSAEVSTVSGIAARTYSRWIFWFFRKSTPYYATSSIL